MMRTRGFSLIEMAIALFIMSLLVGSILIPITAQVERRQVTDTEQMLSEARSAILSYAIANGYLPCPDLTIGTGSNDGREDLTGSNCTSNIGNIPASTLGLNGADPWGNKIRYRVDTAFTNRAALFGLATGASIRVCATATCASILTDSSTPGNEAVFVLVSHGKNGFGAIKYSTGVANAMPTSADELANTGTGSMVLRSTTAVGSAAGEFDDALSWVGKYQIFGMMVSAGKLP
jgi:prepilin-type N-terminal cleavage/methylation domain-containing protein